ncbi:nucleotide exchange factor GrpE [Actinomyces sp. MRS3W]|uniref:nucleotide exchange factor GrpE n=1 Tax=Actinomyces sp. MRS3W TaxID=2800796 RepID=UPI0028FD4C68|nr:nucleotide exchange factor GrpE [Actinomyces sp. MRS3W]MDU0347306.1 nucleotide exchange factor GrpE [Actinomyces sp. MRS3W]
MSTDPDMTPNEGSEPDAEQGSGTSPQGGAAGSPAAGSTSGDGQIDSALADEIESAFDGVDLGSGPADAAQAADAATSSADASAKDEAPSELEQARAQAAQAADDLARARADLYNLQQEYQGFVRRSRENAAGHREAGQASVVETLIPVLDEIELARQHGDLTGTFATTAGKLEQILADKFGLVRFGEVGEVFDPTLHEALMATESAEVTEPSIALVLQPGYKLGERVVRAARVQVANPA